MLKSTLLFFLALGFVSGLQANPGDTVKVRSHDNVHMGWYGNYDAKAKFPDASKKYNRVLMHYTLGCPTSGCSQWDYTTQIFALKHTGKNDSVIETSPNFLVNGNTMDTLYFNTFLTYKYFFDSAKKSIDSLPNDDLNIDIFNDSTHPKTPTSSINGWKGNYYRPVYDSTGKKTDSAYIGYEQMLVRKDLKYYRVFEVIEDYELGRVITPYNGGVPQTWKYTYDFDVTDYITLLRDSVEIRAFYSGYSDGFTVTLDFDFVEGTPARECYKVERLWVGSFPYGTTGNSIENYLTAKNVTVDANAEQVKLRIIQTGHGFGGNENCAEFCGKTQYIKINGTQRFNKLVWRDNCGLNPIYPQGGTWLYDRANWCPGAEVAPFDYEISQFVSKGNTAVIDMDMEDFTNVNNNFCSYTISGLVFYYKQNTYASDASMEEIMAPNDGLRYNRFNPTCNNPLIKVRNNGSDTITAIEFSHGPKGGNMSAYTWSGKIAPYQTTDISLGNINFTQSNPGNNVYEVQIAKVNGKADEVPYNNVKSSTYTKTPIYPNTFVILLSTNNFPQDNSYTIRDFEGKVLVSRNGFAATKQYRDTITLTNGCYTFELKDEAGDGLYFWAYPEGGQGSLAFRKLSNGTLKSFGADFGRSIVHNFTVGYTLGMENEAVQNFEVLAFPNPTAGSLFVDVSSVERGDNTATVQLMDLKGSVLYSETTTVSALAGYEIPMQQLSSGLYLLRISTPENTAVQKVIKQ